MGAHLQPRPAAPDDRHGHPSQPFRPGTQPEPVKVTDTVLPDPAPAEAIPAMAAAADQPANGVFVPSSAGAVEFDSVIAASGLFSVIPAVQRIRMGADRAGQLAHVWADEHSVHVLIDEQLVKTVPSNLNAEDLQHLAMRGARPAGPPPAPSSPARLDTIPAGTVIELDRTLDEGGFAQLAGERIKIGVELARQKVTLRLDGHLLHVVHNGVLAKTLASPVALEQRRRLQGARIATTQLPPPAVGPVSVQRRVPRDGVVMVTRQRLRVGRTYAGKIVTIHVEDTHFRVTCDGVQLSLHPRTEQRPVTRWKAKIHAPKL